MIRHALPITTPRLLLRPPLLSDTEAIHAAKAELWPDLQLWMSWAFEDQRPREATEEYIRSVMDWEDRQAISLAGFDLQSGDFVVSTGLDPLEVNAGSYTTGYWVAKSYQGRGLATEAANAVIRYAFAHLGAREIRIVHYGGNEGSRRVIEKLGFTPLGVETCAVARCLDGELLDRHNYVMTSPSVLPPLDVKW